MCFVMRLYYFSLLFLAFLVFGCDSKKPKDSQDKDRVENSSISSVGYNQKLEVVRANFKRINSIKHWTVIDSVELDDSTEGGQAKFYFANKQLQKIVAVYYGESGKNVIEYYLLDSKLSFVYREDIRYNRPIYWNESDDDEKFDSEKSAISKTRSYFFNDVLFEQIKETKESQEILKDHLEKQQESIQADYSSLKQLSLVRQI